MDGHNQQKIFASKVSYLVRFAPFVEDEKLQTIQKNQQKKNKSLERYC